MLTLQDSSIFARGGRRICYVHPDDPMKCVKVLSSNGDPVKRRREAVWYKRLRPCSMFDDNLRELKSFQVLERHQVSVWEHFPRCYGIHDTDCGKGIVTDLIRDADGLISKTVRQYVKASGKTPELLEALDEFFLLLQHEQVITRDILDHNIVVQVLPDRLRVVMIDGFGSSDFFPLSRWFPAVGQQKVARKVERCRRRYGF